MMCSLKHITAQAVIVEAGCRDAWEAVGGLQAVNLFFYNKAAGAWAENRVTPTHQHTGSEDRDISWSVRSSQANVTDDHPPKV